MRKCMKCGNTQYVHLHTKYKDGEILGHYLECDIHKIGPVRPTMEEAIIYWNVMNTPEEEKELIRKEVCNE